MDKIELEKYIYDSFIDSYFKLWTNLEALQKAYEDVTISVIVKNQNNEEGKRYENISNIFDCIPAKKDYSELVSVIL